MAGIITIITGVGLLLSGIFTIRYGLKHLLWKKLQLLLRTATNTPLRGIIVGIVAAALFQSSTAVSLITIGLVSAEYLSFRNALGIILGANIGTCSTVQLLTLSLPVEFLIPLLVLCLLLSIPKLTRYIGLTLTGLFSMFTGLSLLTMGLGSLPDMEMLLYVISLAETNAFHGIIAGILTTFLCQSSSAATAILMALADEDLINITTAAYIVYGNNIGSCLSSVVVSTVAPPAAKRVALSHVLLNILGVLLFLPVTNAMTALTLWFASDFASQIAIFHTLFNIISSLLVLPFLRQFSRLIEILVPSKKIR